MTLRDIFPRRALRAALVLLFAAVSLPAQEAPKRQRPPSEEGPVDARVISADRAGDAFLIPPDAASGRDPGNAPMANYTIPAATVTPVIDAVINSAEWSDAATYTMVPYASPWYVITLKMKVDACFLWIAAELRNTLGITHGIHDHIEIWYDKNQNGQWNGPSVDGVFAIPGNHQPPWGTMNAKTVAFSWLGNPAWQTSAPTGAMIYHRAWWLPQPYELPATQGAVARRIVSPGVTQIEAKIDYKNSPLYMSSGTYVNMHFKAFAGTSGICYYFGGFPAPGAGWYFLHYPSTAYMNGFTPAYVPSTGDVFDVVDIAVDNATNFSYANGATDNIMVNITGNPNPPPYAAAWSANLKGPAPLTTTYAFSGVVTFTAAPQTQTITIPTTGLPRGFYEVEVSVMDPTVCGPTFKKETYVVLIHNPDEIPCVVWPGDMNASGTCNLADRGALQKYIYNANTNPLWLKGPTRLLTGRKLATSTPLDIFTWVGQAGLPWATPMGCHMDADGNGNVNNLDLAAIKFNMGKTHAALPNKGPEPDLPGDFSLYRNYPNPFNPSTQIGYELPTESYVTIRVVDVLGRTVRELVNGTQPAGFRSVAFDASDIASGVYYYTMTARATDGTGSFTKSLKMTLSK